MAVLLFIKEKFVDPYIIAIDSSTLLRAKGHLSGTKSSIMIKGVVPCSGIDTDDAMRGFNSVIQSSGYLDIWI